MNYIESAHTAHTELPRAYAAPKDIELCSICVYNTGTKLCRVYADTTHKDMCSVCVDTTNRELYRVYMDTTHTEMYSTKRVTICFNTVYLCH